MPPILQHDRIRAFLGTLANDAALRAYINDRVTVLNGEVAANRLTSEDAALLLEGTHSRVQQVMSKGGGRVNWVVTWVVGN